MLRGKEGGSGIAGLGGGDRGVVRLEYWVAVAQGELGIHDKSIRRTG